MIEDDAVFVLLVAFWCILLLGVIVAAYRRVRLQGQRYRFFALRDEILLLVVRGELAEDSAVYTELCFLTNEVIRRVKDLTLWRFARWYVDNANKSGEHTAQAEEFFAALRGTPPEVQRVAEAFFDAVLQLLVESSVLLRATLLLSRGASKINFPTRALPVYEAYRVSQAQRDRAAAAGVNVRVPA